MKQEQDKQKQELQKLKEHEKALERLVKSVADIKGESGKGQQEIERLKKGMQSNDQLTRVQSKVDLTSVEFQTLRQQIFDRGLLAPPRTEPINEESPPVGALELCEGVLAARLLMRLGFAKEKLERQAEDEEDGSYSARVLRRLPDNSREELDSDDEFSEAERDALKEFRNVSGISAPPDVPYGSTGYCRSR